MPIQDITTEQALVGGTGLLAGGVLVWSKIRRVLARDAVDTSAHQSMQMAMEGLRSENVRLHDEVGRLRAEIDRLRHTVTELTGKIADMGTALTRGALEDQLAREGRLERRKSRDGIATPFPKIEGLPE